MIKRHWEGVMNAATTDVTNARAESINSRIQWVKRMACGYRNRENFRNAVYFHLGGLDLYPEALKSAHTKARSGEEIDDGKSGLLPQTG